MVLESKLFGTVKFRIGSLFIFTGLIMSVVAFQNCSKTVNSEASPPAAEITNSENNINASESSKVLLNDLPTIIVALGETVILEILPTENYVIENLALFLNGQKIQNLANGQKIIEIKNIQNAQNGDYVIKGNARLVNSTEPFLFSKTIVKIVIDDQKIPNPGLPRIIVSKENVVLSEINTKLRLQVVLVNIDSEKIGNIGWIKDGNLISSASTFYFIKETLLENTGAYAASVFPKTMSPADYLNDFKNAANEGERISLVSGFFAAGGVAGSPIFLSASPKLVECLSKDSSSSIMNLPCVHKKCDTSYLSTQSAWGCIISIDQSGVKLSIGDQSAGSEDLVVPYNPAGQSASTPAPEQPPPPPPLAPQ